MEEQILDFIKRRFPQDCHWLNGNCYFFAEILKARFSGDVVYDPIDGHFLLWAPDNGFYDWTGRCEYDAERKRKMVMWIGYDRKDPTHYNRIVRDCIK